MVPRSKRINFYGYAVKLGCAQAKKLFVQTCMSCLACADPVGNEIHLYSPLWMFEPLEDETLFQTIRRRIELIIERSETLRSELQYYGLCWALAHFPAYRFAKTHEGIHTLYSANKDPETIPDKELPSVDTAIEFECQLLEIFDRCSPATSATSRLLGKGFRKSSSVRYVKQQITRQLQSDDNKFITFVIMAGVCGAYSDCKVRTPISLLLDLADHGNDAIIDRIAVLSSRELFLLVCEFLVKAGNRWTILKMLCSVPPSVEKTAVEICDSACRPKLYSSKVSRNRKQSNASDDDFPHLPTIVSLCQDGEINRKVPQSLITKLGGIKKTGIMYRKFMEQAKTLPQGIMLKRKHEEASEDARKLELHATRDALSLSFITLCGQVVKESYRRLDPVYISICTTCSAVRTRAKGGSNSKRAHGVEINLDDGSTRCSNCQQKSIRQIDGRGKVIVAYSRAIDRNRVSFTVCCFCGVFCVFEHRHLIYPACSTCAKRMREKPKLKCYMCCTRLQNDTDSYMPIQIKMKPRPQQVYLCLECFDFVGKETQWLADDLNLLSQMQKKVPFLL